MEEYLKKHDLPSKDLLFKELGIFEPDEDILKSIIDKLLHKMEHYIKFLEDILHPDTGLISMNESSAFSEEEMKNILNLFNELNAHVRKNILIEIDNNEKEKISYFKELFAFWLSKKENVKAIVAKAISVWNGTIQKESIMGYFG